MPLLSMHFRMAVFLISLFGIGSIAAGPMGTFFTEEGSRKELFPAYQKVEKDTLILDKPALAMTQAAFKGPVESDHVVFEKVLTKDGKVAFIYRAQELGKVQPMDFVVALDDKGGVMRVMLTAYRESQGGEVQSKRFLGQFIGKKMGHALQLNRDIDGISGATMSSRAITLGVRKAIFFWNLKYGKN